MTIAPWRSLISGALHRNRSLVYARYLQLATVRADGRPANRTVVFRGFDEATDQLQFVTDRRSEKVNEIAVCSWGEACWYFPKTREQFRLSGQLTVIDVGISQSEPVQRRYSLWQKLSEAARSQFYWPFPGQPKAKLEAFTDSSSETDHPPDSFCVLLLQPDHVDHLELRGTPQNRHLYDYDPQQGWFVQAVNP